MPLWSNEDWRARIGSCWCALGRTFNTRFTRCRGKSQRDLSTHQAATMVIMMILFVAAHMGLYVTRERHKNLICVLFGETITELHLFRFGLLLSLFVPVLKFVVQMVCGRLPRKLKMSLKNFFIDLNDGLWFIGSVIQTFIVSPVLFVVNFTAGNICNVLGKLSHHLTKLIGNRLSKGILMRSLVVVVIVTIQLLVSVVVARAVIYFLVMISGDVEQSRGPGNIDYSVTKELLVDLETTAVQASLLLRCGDVESNPGPLTREDIQKVDNSTSLTEDHLRDVFREVVTIKSTYYHLGLELGLSPGELDPMRMTATYSIDQALSDVLLVWLRQRYNIGIHGAPTWQRLVEAVNSPSGGNNPSLAMTIANKHLVNGAERYSMVSVAVGEKGKGGSSLADSGLGTYSRQSGPTLMTRSQFSDQEIFYRDVKDNPFPRIKYDSLHPLGNSSQLELHQASRRGDVDEVKRLVEEKKLNPLEKNDNGNTALHVAAVDGNLDVTRYLIEEQSLLPACLGWHGQTPLHAAAENNHLKLVDYLVAKQQVDPDCKDEDGFTPLHRACLGGDVKVISYLVNKMSNLTPLKDFLYYRTKEGNTPLNIAALKGHLKVVQLFISEYNVDPNTPGQWGRLPLHDAAQEGFIDVVKYLIEEHNTDPSCHDEGKHTPLHLAAGNGRLDVVKYLTLDKHCNPLDRDSEGNTPLHESALHGHLNVVDFFVSQLNVDVNSPGWKGRTLLHKSVQGGSLDIAKYLIEEKRCNPSCLDELKIAPLHLACGQGHLHIVAYLIKEQHCNPLIHDIILGTPLHWAANNGQLYVVKYFIEDLKCPQNIRGPRNITPLEEARIAGHTNIVEYLTSQSRDKV